MSLKFNSQQQRIEASGVKPTGAWINATYSRTAAGVVNIVSVAHGFIGNEKLYIDVLCCLSLLLWQRAMIPMMEYITSCTFCNHLYFCTFPLKKYTVVTLLSTELVYVTFTELDREVLLKIIFGIIFNIIVFFFSLNF